MVEEEKVSKELGIYKRLIVLVAELLSDPLFNPATHILGTDPTTKQAIYLMPSLKKFEAFRSQLSPNERKIIEQLHVRIEELKNRPGTLEIELTTSSAETIRGDGRQIFTTRFKDSYIVYSQAEAKVFWFDQQGKLQYTTELNVALGNKKITRKTVAAALGLAETDDQLVGVPKTNSSLPSGQDRTILNTQTDQTIGLPFTYEAVPSALRQRLAHRFVRSLGDKSLEMVFTGTGWKEFRFVVGPVTSLPEEVSVFDQNQLSRPKVYNGRVILSETGEVPPAIVITNRNTDAVPRGADAPVLKLGGYLSDETAIDADLLRNLALLESGDIRHVHQVSNQILVVVETNKVSFVNRTQNNNRGRTSQELISHNLVGVDANVNQFGDEVIYCPAETDIIYQVNCAQLNPGGRDNESLIVRTRLPKVFKGVSNPQLDKSGNFLMFQADGKDRQLTTYVFYKDYSDPNVWRVLNELDDVHNAYFVDDQIHAVKNDGRYGIYNTNLAKLREDYELSKKVKAIDVTPHDRQRSDEIPLPVKLKIDEVLAKINQKLQDFTLSSDPPKTRLQHLFQYAQSVQSALNQIVVLDAKLTTYVENSGQALRQLTAEIQKTADQVVISLLTEMTSFVSSISMANVQRLNALLDETREVRPHLEPQRAEIVSNLITDIEGKIRLFYEQNTAEIEAQVDSLVNQASQELRLIENQHEMKTWINDKSGNYRARLIAIDQSCPSHAIGAKRIIDQARINLEDAIREKLDELQAQRETLLQKERQAKDNKRLAIVAQITTLVRIARDKHPGSGADAKKAIESDQLYAQINEQIASIDDVDTQVQIREYLEVQVEALTNQVDSVGITPDVQDGHQYIRFGQDTFYPQWEPPEISTGQIRGVELTWIPIAHARDTDGDLGYVIKTSEGNLPPQRLYVAFGEDQEAQHQHGFHSHLGVEEGQIILSAREARAVVTQYHQNWQGNKPVEYSQGDEKKQIVLKDELARLRDNIIAVYATKPKLPAGVARNDSDPQFRAFLDKLAEWKTENRLKIEQGLSELSSLYQRFPQIVHFIRADQVESNARSANKLNPWEDHLVDFSPHWRIDQQAEESLVQMTELFIQQERLGQGMVVLDGPAGTGKDILIRIWCAKTKSPLYSFDCTKWTTEKELTQKVTVTLENGQPITAYIPSSIIQGIQVSGAVVYFNEYNAMPIESQLVLNALLDEKRQISLKLEGGRIVRVARGVKFCASQNSGYAGTNTSINPATVSRTTPIQITYPSFNAEVDISSTQKKKIYLPNEAMRMSGYSQLLRRLSRGAELDKVPFNIYWNIYINELPSQQNRLKSKGGDMDDLPEATQYELRVMCALMIYSQEIRRLHLTKSNDPNVPVLPIPIDGRALAYCVDYLSFMVPESEKRLQSGIHDKLALNLIETYYVSKLSRAEDRDKLMKHLRNSVNVRIPPA